MGRVRKHEVDGELGRESVRSRRARLHELERGLGWVDVRADFLPRILEVGAGGGGSTHIGGESAGVGGGASHEG